MVKEKLLKKIKSRKSMSSQAYFHAMLMPGMIFLLIFSYIPMFGIIDYSGLLAHALKRVQRTGIAV